MITVTNSDKPLEVKLSELPEIQVLRVNNLYLKYELLQRQLKRLQDESKAIEQQHLPAIVELIKKEEKLESYDYDYPAQTFKLRVAEVE